MALLDRDDLPQSKIPRGQQKLLLKALRLRQMDPPAPNMAAAATSGNETARQQSATAGGQAGDRRHLRPFDDGPSAVPTNSRPREQWQCHARDNAVPSNDRGQSATRHGIDSQIFDDNAGNVVGPLAVCSNW